MDSQGQVVDLLERMVDQGKVLTQEVHVLRQEVGELRKRERPGVYKNNYNLQEASNILGVSVYTLAERCRMGAVKCSKELGEWRIPGAEVRRLDECRRGGRK